MSLDANKQTAQAFYELLFNACEPRQAVERYVGDRYIQHNLIVPDGKVGFIAYFERMAQEYPGKRVHFVRVLAEGDFVVLHTRQEWPGDAEWAGMDIFRFEAGKIVEHWDNLQETAGPNPSGHTMLDGPTEPANLQRTAENKKFVAAFVDDILVNGRMEKLASYFDGDRYIQHNPQIANGLSGLDSALKAMAEAGVTMKYDRVHRVLGEGDFVLVVSEGAFAGKPTSFYDLFRVENGKIAEHWDTIETIPPRSEWKNGNGKF